MVTPRDVLPVVGYLRVSSVGQIDGHGYDRQREDINEWASANNAGVVRWYCESHTGTEIERPAFSEMLTDLMNDGVKTVVVASLDRFSRDSSVQTFLISKLGSCGLDMFSAATGANVVSDMRTDPTRRAMIQLQAVFAEWERGMLVSKLRRARVAKKAATGRCEGVIRFGGLPGEYVALNRMAELRLSGKTLGEIGATLDAEGLKPRKAAKWSRGSVLCILNSATMPIGAGVASGVSLGV